jgi:hypothetical protein
MMISSAAISLADRLHAHTAEVLYAVGLDVMLASDAPSLITFTSPGE